MATIVSHNGVRIIGWPIRTGFQQAKMADVFKDFPDLKNHHSSWWRCGALPLRTFPRCMRKTKVLIWLSACWITSTFWYLCYHQRVLICYWIIIPNEKHLVSAFEMIGAVRGIWSRNGSLFWWYENVTSTTTRCECLSKNKPSLKATRVWSFSRLKA